MEWRRSSDIVDHVPVAVSPAHLSVTGDGVWSAILRRSGAVKTSQLVKTENNLAYISGLQDGDILLTTPHEFLAREMYHREKQLSMLLLMPIFPGAAILTLLLIFGGLNAVQMIQKKRSRCRNTDCLCICWLPGNFS